MGNACIFCKFFDNDDTSLPVCTLHRRFMHEDWICGDFERFDEEEPPEGEEVTPLS